MLKSRNTKIIATVGPAISTPDRLLEMMVAGVDVFRLNFSHGTHEEHAEVINTILDINEKYKLHTGIVADLQGPKLRIGKVENNGLKLEAGEDIKFINTPMVGTKEAVYMSYELFARDVKVGEKVLVDDGKLVFEVLETNGKDVVRLKTLFGGTLSSNKGVNLPDTYTSLPCITEKDAHDLAFLVKYPVNWIALSFVRRPEDIKDLRKLLRDYDHRAKIIAKIEKPEAVANIDRIIAKTDAVMVARGDLGVEVPIERLPVIQKDIINKCLVQGKPVIVATQMMESMITNPSPTRAEVTDVANAVLDGTDAVMLSAETSVGAHPIQVVQAMSKIIEESEKFYSIKEKLVRPSRHSATYYSDVVCYNAVKTAEMTDAKALIGITVSGYTAFRMSSYRPHKYIFIFSHVKQMLATLNLVWGVRTLFYDKYGSTDQTISDVVELLKEKGYLKEGDFVVNTGSMPLAKRGRTNMLKLTLVE